MRVVTYATRSLKTANGAPPRIADPQLCPNPSDLQPHFVGVCYVHTRCSRFASPRSGDRLMIAGRPSAAAARIVHTRGREASWPRLQPAPRAGRRALTGAIVRAGYL